LYFLETAVGITTLSSREFNQHASEAKQAAGNGPVFITDRGRPAHVLLNIDDYRKLVGAQVNLAQALADPTGGKFKFTPPRMSGKIRPADLS
jgi:prevent-host-death family protein